jgi:hypothetical protein
MKNKAGFKIIARYFRSKNSVIAIKFIKEIAFSFMNKLNHKWQEYVDKNLYWIIIISFKDRIIYVYNLYIKK